MRVAVIGAGISGLACTLKLLELKEKNRGTAQIVLYEASGHVGGTIETENRDGFILEKGPDWFWIRGSTRGKQFACGVQFQRHEIRKPVSPGFCIVAGLCRRGF